jgi:hypothetical protein
MPLRFRERHLNERHMFWRALTSPEKQPKQQTKPPERPQIAGDESNDRGLSGRELLFSEPSRTRLWPSSYAQPNASSSFQKYVCGLQHSCGDVVSRRPACPCLPACPAAGPLSRDPIAQRSPYRCGLVPSLTLPILFECPFFTFRAYCALANRITFRDCSIFWCNQE